MCKLERLDYSISSDLDRQRIAHASLNNLTLDYLCGGCGKRTHARVIAQAKFTQDAVITGIIHWCFCSCGQPTVVRVMNTQGQQQWPPSVEYTPGDEWPTDAIQLYREAALTLAVGAYTTCAMVCRKILMVCAVDKGEKDGKAFTHYVDFIASNILKFPDAKKTLDIMRGISNDANHKIAFVKEKDAHRSMKIIKSVLDAIYTLPAV